VRIADCVDTDFPSALKEATMRITVDRARCEGHGLCVERSPDLFTMDDDGELMEHYGGVALPDSLESDAASAVAVCPVAALSLEDNG
jgi:ferredoxin